MLLSARRPSLAASIVVIAVMALHVIRAIRGHTSFVLQLECESEGCHGGDLAKSGARQADRGDLKITTVETFAPSSHTFVAYFLSLQ